MSDAIAPLMAVIDAYEAASGLSDSTVSSRVFNDGGKIGAMRRGAGITINRFVNAMAWFSGHWPDGADWPHGVDRPAFEEAEPKEQPIDIDLPKSLKATRIGAIAHLRLNRAEKRNALDDVTVLGLDTFFARLPADIRAVVLTGEGAHFSAGLDLSEVADQREPIEGVLHSRMWHRAFDAIQFGRAPVIVALHGAVVGGGLELAAAAHIRVAERSAYYGLPEGQRGIFLGGGGSVRIARLIGVSRVMDMMLTGRILSAEEGQAAGATQYLVDNGKGFETAMALAAKAASNTSTTNFAVLHALPRIAESSPASGLLTESLMAAIAEASGEAKERLKDFLEKRAAKVTRQS